MINPQRKLAYLHASKAADKLQTNIIMRKICETSAKHHILLRKPLSKRVLEWLVIRESDRQVMLEQHAAGALEVIFTGAGPNRAAFPSTFTAHQRPYQRSELVRDLDQL